MRSPADPSASSGKSGTYLNCWPPEEDLLALCELAAQLCEAPIAAIDLAHEGKIHTIVLYGTIPEAGDADTPLSAATLADGEDVYLEDVRQDPRYAAACRDVRLGEGHMYAAVLLRDPEGIPVGTLSVTDPRPDRRAERRKNTVVQRRRMLATLARQVVDLFELSVRTEELARINAELERSQRHLAAFTSQVSHDLKNPLTATLAWAELMAELPAVAGDADASHYLQRCVASGRRMLTMIEEFLEYAGIGGALDRRQVPIGEAMSAVVQDLGEMADRGTIRWSGVDVDADPVQLRAVLQNLVVNALTYTQDGVRPEVEVTTRDTPLGIQLVVADNGSGIPPRFRDQVLLPLARHRTDVPGIGIGLATCHRIMADHGGTLEIRDRRGGGTAIVATFPHARGVTV